MLVFAQFPTASVSVCQLLSSYSFRYFEVFLDLAVEEYELLMKDAEFIKYFEIVACKGCYDVILSCTRSLLYTYTDCRLHILLAILGSQNPSYSPFHSDASISW